MPATNSAFGARAGVALPNRYRRVAVPLRSIPKLLSSRQPHVSGEILEDFATNTRCNPPTGVIRFMGKTFIDERYELRGLVGSGGMADVYLAHDEVLDRDVALKLLKAQYAEDEEFVERFRREARSAASLSHPHIVPIFDQGESGDDTYYIANPVCTFLLRT